MRYFGGAYDEEGNYRVTRTVWASMRKICKLKYYDETTGDEMCDIVDEKYTSDKNKGEEVD